MSLSRKKLCCDEMPLFSVTEKLRLNAQLRGGFKRPCCGKENEGKECKQGKNREVKQRVGHDDNRSLRKQRKKKFIQQEVERMKQYKHLDEGMRFGALKEYNACQISVLKEDMREMKDVISKLSIQQHRDQKHDLSRREQQESDKLCANLKNQINELQEQLEIQRQTNFKLQEAHIQSQLYAKQTAEFSQTIKKELNDLTHKHLSCEQTYRELQQQREVIQSLNQQLSTCRLTINDEKMKRQSLSKGMTEEMKKSDEKLIQIEKLQEEKKQLSASLQKLNFQFEEGKSKQAKMQLQITGFAQEKEDFLQEKLILQQQCQRLQDELRQASMDLSDTRVKLGSLGSMEQKCQELYQEIKRERLKWDATTMEEQLEKQKIDMTLTNLQSQKANLLQKIENLEKENYHIQENSEKLQIQNKRLFEDRVNLAKQNRNLQNKIQEIQAQLQQISRSNQQMITTFNAQQLSFQQQKSKWIKQKQKLQTRLEWLSRQKTAIEQQVNGTLEVVKKRHDDIVMRNTELQHELNSIKQQKQMNLEASKQQFTKITHQNEMYKTVIGQKQLKNIEQQIAINNYQQQVNQLNGKVRQIQKSFGESKLEWQGKYAEVLTKLQNCEASLQVWKDKFQQQKNTLTLRNQKIESLLAENQKTYLQYSQLSCKIESVEVQLKNSQSARFSLCEQLSSLQESTKRNAELIQQQKSLYECQINLKNKCISELKSTIKLVKDESVRIMEEIEIYREQVEASTKRDQENKIEVKYRQFSTLVEAQLQNLRGRIDHLSVEKNELERVLTFLRASNNQLSDKIYKMSCESDKQCRMETQQQNKSLQDANKIIQQLRQQQKRTDMLREQYIKQLQIKEKQISMLNGILQEERRQFASQPQENNNYQKLAKIIEQKDETLKRLTERINVYEEKRIKIVSEVHTIQNQISELEEKNSLLEQENKQLSQNLERSEEQLRLTEERMKMMLEHKLALQQQKAALEEQSTIFKDQISKGRLQQQKAKKQFNEIIQIYQNRKGEAIGSLQAKIQQLANQLSSSIEKLTLKNIQIENLQQKCIKLQQVLEDNHMLLNQERTERERLHKVQNQLTTQIQTHKNQKAFKEKEAEAISHERISQKQQLHELQAKLQSMKRKYECADHERAMAQRQIENNQVSIRILREQNRNIQKVMSDQLLQRKSMIEQLINQKRTLYAQLHHE